MNTALKIVTITLLLTLLVGVAAIYFMASPASDPVTVSPAPTITPTPTQTPQHATLSKVTVSSTNINVGSELTLTTTVSDHIQGLTVTFYDNTDEVLGTAQTNSEGTASLTIIALEPGTFTFYATANHP
jgi:Flp pilus assembly protein CpaB